MRNVKEIIKQLVATANVTRGRINSRQVYRDFIAYCALLISIRTDPVHQGRNEQLQVLMKNYKDNELDAFALALKEVAHTIERNTKDGLYADVLGSAFVELGAANRGLKQDFTPMEVARLLSQITYGNSLQLPEEGFFTLSDPTCGSGVLLLAAAEQLSQQKFNTAEELVIQAADLDTTCVQMTFIQLSLYGIPAVVIRGNSLTLKELDRWYTPVYLWRKWVWRAPQPFGTNRNCYDEQLKMLDEPLYAAYRQVNMISRKVR